MSARYIHHVTLTTGHSRPSPRSEVGDDTVAMLRPLLSEALEGEGGRHVTIPNLPSYTMTAAAFGRCCLVILWGPRPESARPERIPILTTGIAGHSRCGARLWRELHGRDDLTTDPADVPPEPWCADRLEPGAAAPGGFAAMDWTGDWSRCIAWTWLELRGDGPQ